jgi:uncharacterized repeat protein (TIGR02543 family)
MLSSLLPTLSLTAAAESDIAAMAEGDAFTISYIADRADSGEAPTDRNIYSVSEIATVAGKGTLTREGHRFEGWNSQADRLGYTWHEGQGITTPDPENIRLYDTWSLDPTGVVLDTCCYYNGHIYTVYEKSADGWTDAEIFCELMGGHLATINSAEENGFLYNTFAKNYNHLFLGGRPQVEYDEIGAFIAGWAWVVAEEPWSYDNWGEEYDIYNYNFYPAMDSSGKWIATWLGTSSYFIYENDKPPVAEDVTVSPESGKFYIGETLTGSFTYPVDRTDENISVYRWYSADDVDGTNKILIPDANTKTLTLTESLLGKYIAFEVTPLVHTHSEGAVNGLTQISGWYGPVILGSKSAPAGLEAAAPTSADNTDGQITGVDDTMEYRFGESEYYTSIATGATVITGLIPGDYYIRYAAAEGCYSASPETKVTVPWYAQAYNITYDGNGGTSAPVDSTEYEENSEATILGAGDMTKAGYIFTGWNTAADGSGIDYTAGQTVTVTGSLTLYAQWLDKASLTFKYYRGHAYAVIDSSMCWTDAYKLCADVGGHLAEIETEEENSFITGIIGSYGEKSWYWLGGTDRDTDSDPDIDTEGSWFWVGGDKWWENGIIPEKYSNWNDGEPSNNGDEDYLVIYTEGLESFPAGTWNDYDNYAASDGTGLSYIGLVCEIDSPAALSYRVKYDRNGGDIGFKPPEDSNIYDGKSAATVLAAEHMTRAGYYFTDWNTKADGTGAAYRPGDTFVPCMDVTLYAMWEPLPIFVTGVNGGSIELNVSCGETSLLAAGLFDSSGRAVEIKLSEVNAGGGTVKLSLASNVSSEDIIKIFLIGQNSYRPLTDAVQIRPADLIGAAP